MSAIVYKFPLRQPVVEIGIPADARVVDVDTQEGVPTLWVLLDPDAPLARRTFVGVPTGSPVGVENEYVGSAHGVEGWMVFHIFERDRP